MTPNQKDDLHWQREMIGVIHAQMPQWVPFAAGFTRELCKIYGPHRDGSQAPQDLIDYMFLNAEEITADFQRLIKKGESNE